MPCVFVCLCVCVVFFVIHNNFISTKWDIRVSNGKEERKNELNQRANTDDNEMSNNKNGLRRER